MQKSDQISKPMPFSGGMYIHIPFCRKACHYCNFHFTTSLYYKDNLVNALCKEIELKAKLFSSGHLTSIYFGGGTPSLLSSQEINLIYQTIGLYFSIAEDAEITLEANPDDLTLEYLLQLKTTRINRLSIGIQSFYDEDLQYLGRAHDSSQAQHALDNANEVGFININADLIFGFPSLTEKKLLYNLHQLTKRNIPHISAYNLTIEEKTFLYKLVKNNKTNPPEENQNAHQFEIIHNELIKNEYEHYEISNYCRVDMEAKHNSSYWLGEHYIGIGPAAHSYYGASRTSNITNNQQYMRAITSLNIHEETEVITPEIAYNELILTRLRTKWGVSLNDIYRIDPRLVSHFNTSIFPYLESGELIKIGDKISLTLKGMLIADHLATELFT